MREQRTKAQVKKKSQKQSPQDNTHPLSPLPHPVINQPPPHLFHHPTILQVPF